MARKKQERQPISAERSPSRHPAHENKNLANEKKAPHNLPLFPGSEEKATAGGGSRANAFAFKEGDPDLDPAWLDSIRQPLIAWYGTSARALPWRADRDPYRILVSEMMLVQTTVATVIPYFARFLERFPTLADLALAEEDDVLKAWEGLGYYRRARQLQGAAKAVLRDHNGVFPSDPESIRNLPGVGPYIAGALLSFAFDQPAPILEANTQRVVARWLAWDQDLKAKSTQNRLWQAAARLVPDQQAGTFNQAFMELGALVCSPRKPLCSECPVSRSCLSHKLGVQDKVPVVTARAAPRQVKETAFVVPKAGRMLLLQRGRGRLWESFWEFPTQHQEGPDPAGRLLADAPAELGQAEFLERLTGVRADVGPVLTAIKYGVTTHRVTMEARLAEWVEGDPEPREGFVDASWESLETVNRLTLSSASRQLVAWLAERRLLQG